MSIMRYTHTNTYTRSVCARLNYVYAAYAADQKSSVGATHAACVHLSSLGCHVEPVSVICPGASQINFVPDHSCLGKQAKEGRRGVCHMPHTYLMASVPHKVCVCLCVCRTLRAIACKVIISCQKLFVPTKRSISSEACNACALWAWLALFLPFST